MTDSDRYRPPHIVLDGLPEVEREDAWLVIGHLMSLSRYVEQVKAAFSLAQFANVNLQHVNSKLKRSLADEDVMRGARDSRRLTSEMNLLAEWNMIAGRDAAMTVYHFAEAVESSKMLIHKCPTLKSMIDRKQIRAAQKSFSQTFPQYEQIRHAIAHDAELSDSPKAFSRNSHSGEFEKGSLKIGESTSNVRFTGSVDGEIAVTINGQILTFALNKKTADDLRERMAEFYACFRKAEMRTRDNAYPPA